MEVVWMPLKLKLQRKESAGNTRSRQIGWQSLVSILDFFFFILLGIFFVGEDDNGKRFRTLADASQFSSMLPIR
jgi:hypothetical protein